MSVAPGGNVVIAAYVNIEKCAQEMLRGDINFSSLPEYYDRPKTTGECGMF
jgi:hypothetical protein